MKTTEELKRDLQSSDSKVVSIAVYECTRNPDASLAPFLARSLANSDPVVQSNAVMALSCIGILAIEHILPFLESGEVGARREAARVLGRIGHSASTYLLIRKLKNDSDSQVRRLCAAALGKIELGARKESRATCALIAAIKDQNSGVRTLAVRALGWIGNPDAEPMLRAALYDSCKDVRRDAATALKSARNPLSILALAAALKDEAIEVQHAAGESLRAIGGFCNSEISSMMNERDDSHIISMLMPRMQREGNPLRAILAGIGNERGKSLGLSSLALKELTPEGVGDLRMLSRAIRTIKKIPGPIPLSSVELIFTYRKWSLTLGNSLSGKYAGIEPPPRIHRPRSISGRGREAGKKEVLRA